MAQQKLQVQPEEVRRISAQGAKLLRDRDRVNVPTDMALDGSYQLLVMVLDALSSGEVMIGHPAPSPEGVDDPPASPAGDHEK